MDVLSTRRPFRWYGPGGEPPAKVAGFEKEFAARMQTRYALGVTSGTAALQCAMAALKIGPGDEVILPAWTWHSCFNAIVLAGALPVFAEIDALRYRSGRYRKQDHPADESHHGSAPTGQSLRHGSNHSHRPEVQLPLDRRLRTKRRRQATKAARLVPWLISPSDSLQINKTITSGEGGAVVTNDPVLFERCLAVSRSRKSARASREDRGRPPC